MNVVELSGLQAQEALYVWSQSFERGDRAMEDWKDWETRYTEGRCTLGIYDGDVLQAAFLLVDKQVCLGETGTVPIGAVCGVGVLPASRGRGYAAAGVRALFERMRERELPFSILEPFSWDYYGRLGYAWTASTRQYSAPTRCLRPSPETERVRPAEKSDQQSIVNCYLRFARNYRGMVLRRPEVWQMQFDRSKTHFTYTYVYEADGAVEGYLSYHGGKREETRLDEFIALSSRARRGLLGLLRRHEMQIEKFRWTAPEDDLLWHELAHNDLETKLVSRHMVRIVDVPRALAALRPPPDSSGRFVLGVQDESAPWNRGAWQIDFAEGSVSATRTGADLEVALPIDALAQAYFGSPDTVSIRSAGLIDVHDERAFRCLAALLQGPPAWCNDGF